MILAMWRFIEYLGYPVDYFFNGTVIEHGGSCLADMVAVLREYDLDGDGALSWAEMQGLCLRVDRGWHELVEDKSYKFLTKDKNYYNVNGAIPFECVESTATGCVLEVSCRA